MALGSGGRDLRVNLISDVSKFAKGLRSAENDARSFSQKSVGMFKAVGVAAAGAAAAIAVVAVKIGTDAVKAAIEEEQSVGRLTKTLKNLGLAHEDTRVEQFIDDMQFATGVADNELRPAYDRLIRSTGDIDEANRALAISLDIAVAKGLDVKSVADVLGKAYDGNTMALGRMGVAIDRSVLKSGDMGKIIQALIDKFGGQANAAANTLGGAIQGVQIGWDELVESFGKGLVGDTADDIKKLQELKQQLRDMQPAAENAGETVHDIGVSALTTFDRLDALGEAANRKDWSQFWDMFTSFDDDQAWQRKIEAYRNQLRQAEQDADATAAANQSFEGSLLDAANAMGVASAAAPEVKDGLLGIETGAVRSTTALQRLQGALDGVFSSAGSFGQAQEKFAQGIAWTQLLAQGPGKSGSSQSKVPGKPDKNGKPTWVNQTSQFSTPQDYLDYANQLVSQAVATAKTLGPKRANKLLQNAQDRVANLLALAGYDNPRKTAAGLIGPVNINPNPRPWEQMYRDGPTSKAGWNPVREQTQRLHGTNRANSRSAQKQARTNTRP